MFQYLLKNKGDKIFGFESGISGDMSSFRPTQHLTMIFNSFVLMNLFNEINSRKINNDVNVFRGSMRDPKFYVLWLITFGLQVK